MMMYRIAWGPYARGARGNCPACPCVKTALILLPDINQYTKVLTMEECRQIVNEPNDSNLPMG